MRLDPSRQDLYAFFIATPYVLMGRDQDAIPYSKGTLPYTQTSRGLALC
jgi:hypothetical protein